MNGEILRELVSSKDNCHSCTTYYSVFFPSVSEICCMVRLIVIILNRIFAPNGTHCKLWQVLSVQDDGSVWKKIIKMWERNFCIMTNNISNMRKISQERLKLRSSWEKGKSFYFHIVLKLRWWVGTPKILLRQNWYDLIIHQW